jgi:hypothetical protein
MARAGTVAVLLPGAFYFIRETTKPPVELFRAHGVNMALATDCNPGSSPLTSLLLAMNMGATLFRMTVAECLAGVTREGARALGILGETGTLEAGKWCDLAIWDIDRPAELVYRIGFNPLHRRVWRTMSEPHASIVVSPGKVSLDDLAQGWRALPSCSIRPSGRVSKPHRPLWRKPRARMLRPTASIQGSESWRRSASLRTRRRCCSETSLCRTAAG